MWGTGRRAATCAGALLVAGAAVTPWHGAAGITLCALFALGLLALGSLERRQVELALRERARDLRAITDAVPGVVFQFEVGRDGGYRFSFISRGVRQLLELGSDIAEVSFDEFIGFVLPADAPGLAASIAEVVQRTGPWAHEFRIETATGRRKWLSAKSMPEPRRRDGSLVFNGLIFDVTERVAAELALEQAKRATDLILEAAGEGIFGVDLAGAITFVNPAAARMLGCGADALIGRPHTSLLAVPSTLPLVVAVGSVTGDTEFRRENGSAFAVEYVSTAIVEHTVPAGAVVVFRDITEARRLSEELLHKATHDELTGLTNRRDFEQRVTQLLETTSEHDSENVLAYVDLDQFKVINDTCGHFAGDELLRQVTAMMQCQLRRSDTLARLGGDEFGILMIDCSIDQAQQVMERVRATIADHRFVWADKNFKIGASIGLVPISGRAIDVSEAFKRADAACYAAKDAGRNRIHAYHENDAELARRQGEMQWVARINEALEQDSFELYAQPIYATAERAMHAPHFEVLLRMKQADGGSVPPGAFLPAAERYGLSQRLDRWVMNQAFSWLASHAGVLPEPSLFCINLSGLTLGDEATLDFIVARFSEYGIAPRRICFEVTETAAIANLARATQFINDLKALGCRFALDDFGSGLSSFAYLKNLPVDYLKIDGMFVRDILDDPMDLAIVRSINEVGHVMGMQTIGEFVENEAIRRKLAELGIDYAQGYGIGRPTPLTTLATRQALIAA